MLQRTPEPELMEDQEQVLAYSRADFSDSGNAFLDYVLDDYGPRIGRVLDLGCGPADLDIQLARDARRAQITAVDGSAAMIALARQKVSEARLQNRITLLQQRLPGLPLSPGSFDLIISKDLLHHIPDPAVFWREVERLAGDRTVVYVMDLLRPSTREEARAMVDRVTGNEAEVLQTDFYNSLLAAFTMEEIAQQMAATSLDFSLELLGERHFIATLRPL